MRMDPSTVTVASGDAQLFAVDDPGDGCEWSAIPDIGSRSVDSTGKTCVYTAPSVLMSRSVAIRARRGDGANASAVITISSAPFWMAALSAFWAALFLTLIFLLFRVWPPPPAVPYVEVYPPSVTVSQGGTAQFTARAWNSGDTDVVWSASEGVITPTGLYTATGTATSAVITAARRIDRLQLGTALVLIGQGLEVRPPYIELGASKSVVFKSVTTLPVAPPPPGSGAAKPPAAPPPNPPPAPQPLRWLCAAPPPMECSVQADGTYTAPGVVSDVTRVVITAIADPLRQASSVVELVPAKGIPDTVASQFGRDQSLMQLVLIMGALGSFLGASRSFVNYIGNRQFAPSWSLFYLFRPSLGAGMALIVFFGSRIGAVTALGSVSPADPFAAAFVAGLVGLFIDLVLGKLQEVVGVLIPSREPRKDSMQSPVPPGTKLPAPTVTSATGSAANHQMTVKGTNFVSAAKVAIGGTNRETTFVSATELTVALDPAKDTAGTVKVHVVNPDGQTSADIDGTIAP